MPQRIVPVVCVALAIAATPGRDRPVGAFAGSVADADGALRDSDVVRVMASRRVTIRKACWEDRAGRVDASMRIDFTVSAAGTVTDAYATDVTGPQTIAACVIGEVKQTIFPASGAGGRFHWPFIFKDA